ncbi:MAG: MBOAT family O-acyltransferase, partial [Phycisphaerae bacterium]
FRHPYFARSIAEFWSRWHISLSTWFKDYLYIPLGGNRVSRSRLVLNLMVVFLISGLWHGANWTFVIWGFLHGMFLIGALVTQRWRDRWPRGGVLGRAADLLAIPVTFGLVCVSWVFFRANTLHDALLILQRIGTESVATLGAITHAGTNKLGLNELGGFGLVFPLATIVFLMVIEMLRERRPHLVAVGRYPTWAKWAVYEILLLSIIFLGTSNAQQFIYFQF